VQGHLLHHRVDVQNHFRIELLLFISGALSKVVLERTADRLVHLLEIGFNLSLELADGREARNTGSGDAFSQVVLLGLFVLNNLFPVGTCQEHEVELVLIFTTVVRRLDWKTGLTFVVGAPSRLDIGVVLADRVGKVGLDAGLFVGVKDFWHLLTLKATPEEVFLGKKITALKVDRISKAPGTIVLAAHVSVTTILGLVALVLLEVFARPHGLVGAVGGVVRGNLG